MTTEGMPEIKGPGAGSIAFTTAPEAAPAETPAVDNAAPEPEEATFDPMFPFGTPEQIDYAKLDQAGVDMIKELNQRPWIKTVEYCSGHPLNRPPEEPSDLYPYVSGENVYEETAKLDMAYVRGMVPDQFFRRRKAELRETGVTRFYLNVNVYNIPAFMEFVGNFCAIMSMLPNGQMNPVRVQYNPLRPGINYTLYWDYWTVEERTVVHMAMMEALANCPI